MTITTDQPNKTLDSFGMHVRVAIDQSQSAMKSGHALAATVPEKKSVGQRSYC